MGRVDELPSSGDWKLHKIFDQSYIVVRGKDGKIRGFVNACRHRGNALCQAANGQSGPFTRPYHLWTYGLDGKLLAVARPDLVGKLDKADHGLVKVLIDTFAGSTSSTPTVARDRCRPLSGRRGYGAALPP